MSQQCIVDRCVFSPGEIADNQYLIKKSLGEGSFGAVYQVENLHTRQIQALKLLRLYDVPAEIRQPLKGRFKLEYETGQIDCDNLVQSQDYGYVNGNPYIIMEYCPGGDLTPYLGKEKTDVLGICHNILQGLSALHERGKVHRDLKPENVLFKKNGIAALTDFGIVGDSRHRMTHLGILGRPDQIFGTYAYMPPEQANRSRGGSTVLPTTDVFSFGVLAFQLLTGKLPFGNLDSYEDLAEYLKRSGKGLWDINALRYVNHGQHWANIIAACLMPDYRKRLQSAKEVERLLPKNTKGRIMSSSQIVTEAYASPDTDTHIPQHDPVKFCLRVLQGDEYGRIYDLAAQTRHGLRVLTLGRSNNNVLHIKSDFSNFLSRKHCTIEADKEGQHWLVRDGQWVASEGRWQPSSNGTYVNSRPVSSKGYFLQSGDIITCGDVTLRFEKY